MPETRRKLTTIFSADVQDYTRMMRADEEGTLDTLKLYREAMSRLIEAHYGRVINTWGDGLIAEFSSVVEAVRAALDVQTELAGYNADRPDETRMLFRIGINLGDVIAEGDDIYGDGVNVAARLQASATAGGIVISNTVYDQVRNKLAVGFECLGQLQIKNIEGGVLSYAVRIGEDTKQAQPVTPAVNDGYRADLTRTGATAAASKSTSLALLAIIAIGLVGINFLSWDGTFWSRWPLLVLAAIWGLRWAKTAERIDRFIAALVVIGLTIAGINMISWEGRFWAAWPLLAIAVIGGIRWVMRYRRSVGG